MNAESKHQIPGSPAPGKEKDHIPRQGPRPESSVNMSSEQQASVSEPSHHVSAASFQTGPDEKAESGRAQGQEQPRKKPSADISKDVQERRNRSFGGSGGSQPEADTNPVFASVPGLSKQAMLAVRRWQGVPDTTSDQDALAQGIITPEMLQLVMQVVQQLMQGCLSNSRVSAWARIKAHTAAKEMDRLGDNLRLNGVINNWMDRLGIPRDVGDVVIIRKAVVDTADSLKQDEFNALQSEILFLTI